MKQEKDKLRQEIETLAGENWKIKKEINSLKTDLKAVERIARDELGLAGKGEIIYRFVNEEKTKWTYWGLKHLLRQIVLP
jgi:cell division protein FtsB